MAELFEEWLGRVLPEIEMCRKAAQKRLPAGQGLYVMLLEELTDISGVALRLQEEAAEHHQNKVIEILATYPEGGNPKTKLDAAKRTPCNELTVYDSMQNLNNTISFRTGQIQSIIKNYLK